MRIWRGGISGYWGFGVLGFFRYRFVDRRGLSWIDLFRGGGGGRAGGGCEG